MGVMAMKILFTNIVGLMVLENLCFGLVIQNLGGTWSLQNIKKGYKLNGTVPGGIYTDLMRQGIIGDVFFENEDINTRWVSKLDWQYSKTFLVDEELLRYSNINLVFDGLDTFADVFVNGVKVGRAQNMFVRYVFDVSRHLSAGDNTVEVQFKSPVIESKKLFKKQSESYVVPPLCVPAEYNGECHVNHIRKMQASFGWDWGPAFPSMGIWKNVSLQAYNSTTLVDLTTFITSNEKENAWNLQINAYFEGNKDGVILGTLKVTIVTEIAEISELYDVNQTTNKNGEFVWNGNLTIPKTFVNLWWPNGYGAPSLYPLMVSFVSATFEERSERNIKVGFRTVDLVQNEIERGRTFYFKINNIPIYVKGSNVIPISILPELGQNKAHAQFLLQSAKDAHMNMLRVWGGGVYESDDFYDLADELGLLIWQDFMFACSMYPANQNFLKIVTDEVNHQVRRLQYHPSIVVWAASNENEAALRQNWYGTDANFSLYQKDFQTLYVNTIQKSVLLQDNTRPFLTSSPTNGIDSERQGYIAKNPQSHFYGDVHFYNYLVDGFNQLLYPVSRFVSEYGYQSLPSVQTILTATNDINNLDIFSNFLRHRQHHLFGYVEMDLLISYELNLPDYNSPTFDRAFIFYSQIIQAMSVKIATEKFRRWRSNVNDIGEGLTMGSLYWQLNDVWVAPSWSSIDFKQNWKMLHYFARRFFAPVIISNELTASGSLNCYIVSDLLKHIEGATLTLKTYKWNSTLPIRHEMVEFVVLPGSSQKVKTVSLESFLTKDSCGTSPLNNCFIYFSLQDNNNNSIAPDNFFFPTALKHANLVAPRLKTRVRQTDRLGTEFEIIVETDVIALFVWIETRNIRGTFSNNGFVQVSPKKRVKFYPMEAVNISDLEKALLLTNLLDKQFV